MRRKVITQKESKMFFGEGYAMKRNTVLYFALKNKMDYLIFLDDDEYPLATIKINNTITLEGPGCFSNPYQQYSACRYDPWTPLRIYFTHPHFDFNDKLSEDEFRIFVEALNNGLTVPGTKNP